jgi:pimeloyl-ACP methyl ester carboxylesterase
MLCLLASGIFVMTRTQQLPGTTENYHGFVMHRFTVDGCESLLVEPKTAGPGKPWIWRMEFFDHRPMADLSLLEHGYYLGYMNVGNTFGAPKAIAHLSQYYQFVTRQGQLHPKAVLEGFSRGGLYAYNFAAKFPGRVAAIYGDAPVCDFKSWPGGMGKGPGSKEDWAALITSYEFKNEKQALAFKHNPVDELNILAKAHIPILHVIGAADEVVPVTENTDVVVARYKKLGGLIQVISKPGGLHHPHSLDDPTRIVDFILSNTLAR